MTCLFNFNSLFRVAQLAASLHPGCEKMEREWENEEEKERVWGSGEEMERKWGNEEIMRKWRDIRSLHFPIFSLFPPSLSISYIKHCHKMLNTALLSRMSQKNLTCWPVSFNKSVLFNIILFCSSKCPKSGLQIWHGTLLHQLILGVLQ